MNRKHKYTGHLAFGLFLLAVISNGLNAQDQPPQFVREAVRDVEKMLDSEGDAALVHFIEEAMVTSKDDDQEALVQDLRDIRKEMQGLRDDIMVEGEPDGVRLILAGGGTEKQLKIVLDDKARAISDLIILKSPEPIHLVVDNLSETFDQFEEDGMAGVVYVRLGGRVILERAFGMANKELGIPNTLQTVFGTGSRPIDYTVAGIFLLDQQGLIHLDDKISKYFNEVPEDKQSITIRHLMTGQSGLPDFFHTSEDWDPDLAWVDSETALNRLLAQDLLFEPGTDRRHSHGAFGLLALLIEKVSEKTYYSFIRENFLDPAGMGQTGEYGETRGLTIADFAVGGGPQFVGIPNIPPNWGPTSWLIKGSGGMYSTLGNLQKFYSYIRSGKALDAAHQQAFTQPSVNVDGSDRGFELFSASMPPDNEIYLFLNDQGSHAIKRQLFRALEDLVVPVQR
jgi:CubicO group peptidase (beta-lactamase class C family)